MPIKGKPREILLPPVVNKNIDEKECYVPYNIDLRNGVFTNAKYWGKRNGYGGTLDLSYTYPVNCLIPEDDGIAISNKRCYRQILTSPSYMSGTNLNGGSRPQWVKFGERIIVVDGGSPIKIVGGVTSLLGGSPPLGARFIGNLGSYTLMAGHNDTEFKWSASNNPENWTTGNSGFANCKPDGVIRFAMEYREKWYIFKDNSIEGWYNRGGATPFVRLNELGIDKGLLASYSVVKANNIFYWFGHDYNFYMINNNAPQVISDNYQEYIFDNLLNPSELYGFDCRKEACIRWFSPTQGLCFKYDYKNGVFSEENKWISGAWQRLPWNSYMEMNGKQYFGDYNPTGYIYKWDKDYKDDNGDPIRCYRRFAVRLTENGNNAKVNLIRFKVKRGVATATITNPVLLIRCKYDGGSWQNWQQIDLGEIGDYDTNIDSYDFNGIGREIKFEIAHTEATEFLIMNMYLTARQLGN